MEEYEERDRSKRVVLDDLPNDPIMVSSLEIGAVEQQYVVQSSIQLKGTNE